MRSIDLIRDNLKKSADRVLARVDDMKAHSVVFPTQNGGCHTLWVLGHLAYIEALVIRRFMLGEPHPLAEWEKIFDRDDPFRFPRMTSTDRARMRRKVGTRHSERIDCACNMSPTIGTCIAAISRTRAVRRDWNE